MRDWDTENARYEANEEARWRYDEAHECECGEVLCEECAERRRDEADRMKVSEKEGGR